MGELEVYIIQHSSGLYGYLLQHTHNHHTAEDLLQETFLKAFLSLHSEVPENLEAWLLTIAKYTMYDYFKKQKRIVIVEADFFETRIDENHTERQLLEKEAISQAMRLLKKLPEQQQRAIALVQLKGFTYEQASDILTTPVNTLKSQVKRGRQQLRQWKEEEETHGKV